MFNTINLRTRISGRVFSFQQFHRMMKRSSFVDYSAPRQKGNQQPTSRVNHSPMSRASMPANICECPGPMSRTTSEPSRTKADRRSPSTGKHHHHHHRPKKKKQHTNISHVRTNARKRRQHEKARQSRLGGHLGWHQLARNYLRSRTQPHCIAQPLH